MTASAERNQLINRSPEKTTHPSVTHGTKAQDTASRAGLGKVTAVPHCSARTSRVASPVSPCFSGLGQWRGAMAAEKEGSGRPPKP